METEFEPIPTALGDDLLDNENATDLALFLENSGLTEKDIAIDSIYTHAPCGCKFYMEVDQLYLFWKQCEAHAKVEVPNAKVQ